MRITPLHIDRSGKVKAKKRKFKNRKPKNLKAKSMHLWAVDTIQKVSNGIRRYIKMNAHNERFNRTIQEQFVDFHEECHML